MISEMSCCNLRRAGSDYCVNYISPGNFSDFCLKIFPQEKVSSYGKIHVRKIFNYNKSFQTPLRLVLLRKNFERGFIK